MTSALTTEDSHYDVLAIPPDASPDEVRRAYARRLLVVHPDKSAAAAPTAPAAPAALALARIQEAYAVLRDPTSRAAYDDSLRTRRLFDGAIDAYDEVLRSEMEPSADGTQLTHPCRCGDVFTFEDELSDDHRDGKYGECVLECPSCSLHVRVVMTG
jgi:diphthamide biosynthesis protein 4